MFLKICFLTMALLSVIFVFKTIEREFCPFLKKEGKSYILIKPISYWEREEETFNNKKEAFKALLKAKKEHWKNIYKKIKETIKSFFPLLF